jgi:WD40 repeat protein
MSASDDRTVQLWHLPKGALHGVLEGHSEPVTTVAFSPCGSLLASESCDNTVRLWNVDAEKSLGMLAGHSDGIRAVAFLREDNLLASASYYRTVKFSDPSSKTVAQMLLFDWNLSECFLSGPSPTDQTNVGANHVQFQGEFMPRSTALDTDIMTVCGSWLTINAAKLLWLPQDYRPGCVVCHSNTVAIAFKSNKAITIRFDFRSDRPWESLC